MHKLDTARHAGNILRYHTWPTIKQQTNAHHTWNVIRLYIEMFGEPESAVLLFMMYHDVGELDTGDISYVAKSINPGVKTVTAPIEDACMHRLSFQKAFDGMIPVSEEKKVKACDHLEAMEFSLDEMRLGNVFYGWGIFENMYDSVMKVATQQGFDMVCLKADAMLDEAAKLRTR